MTPEEQFAQYGLNFEDITTVDQMSYIDMAARVRELSFEQTGINKALLLELTLILIRLNDQTRLNRRHVDERAPIEYFKIIYKDYEILQPKD